VEGLLKYESLYFIFYLHFKQVDWIRAYVLTINCHKIRERRKKKMSREKHSVPLLERCKSVLGSDSGEEREKGRDRAYWKE
jgi:hypothetical protein